MTRTSINVFLEQPLLFLFTYIYILQCNIFMIIILKVHIKICLIIINIGCCLTLMFLVCKIHLKSSSCWPITLYTEQKVCNRGTGMKKWKKSPKNLINNYTSWMRILCTGHDTDQFYSERPWSTSRLIHVILNDTLKFLYTVQYMMCLFNIKIYLTLIMDGFLES